jgi:hypothetical protein
MVTERAPDGWMLSTVLGRIDRASDEFRRDLADLHGELVASEKRVMTALEMARLEFADYSKAHANEHATRRVEVDGKLSTLGEFMKTREIQIARQDGALGVIRFLLDAGGRNWQLIGVLLGFLGLALGNVTLQVGVP